MASISDYLKNILAARYGKDVRQSIHDAIQQCYYDGKAGSIDLEARQSIEDLDNNKLDKTGDSASNTVTFTSGDSTSPTGWADIVAVASGETHASLFRKFSLAVKNLRYLYKMLGSTDISAIGDGTVTGVLSFLKSSIDTTNSNLNSTNLQTLQSASSNGVISDAMRVDLNDAYGVLNRPCMITSEGTMQNIPADCAWGIREVLYLNENMIVVRITGVKTSGTESKIWTNCYNYGTWTGWV